MGRTDILRWVPPAIWMICILVVSLLPAGLLPQSGFRFLDKAVHFLIYFILAILSLKAASGDTGRSRPLKSDFLFALIFGGVYGIVIELLQIFVPGREASIADAAANLAGFTAGMLVLRFVDS